MLNISYTTKFKKELKSLEKQGKDMKKFLEVAEKLVKEEALEFKYRNHKLQGNFKGRWECHIETDWLLIYCKNKKQITFERTGSHSNLFN